MEGGTFPKLSSRLSARTFVLKFATVSRMEGGSFPKFGSRLSAAHIRLKHLQQVQGWRAVPFQNWALASAPRTFVFKVCNGYRDGGRFLFKGARSGVKGMLV